MSARHIEFARLVAERGGRADATRLPWRLLQYVAICPLTGCWYWSTSSDSRNGYGKVRWQGRLWVAHRLIFTLLVGPIGAGLYLDHLCRQRICCNPDRLEPVTPGENVARGEAVLMKPAAHYRAAD